MRRLRVDMVGGDHGGSVGPLYRLASELDGEIALVGGAFSSNKARPGVAGTGYWINTNDAPLSADATIAGKRARNDGIEFVAFNDFAGASSDRHSARLMGLYDDS